jgi:hypothetical protein
MQNAKVTLEETGGDLLITVRKSRFYRLLRFFKMFFKRFGMFNNKIWKI